MIKRIKKWLWLSLFLTGALLAGLVYYAISPLKLQPNSQEISIQANSGLKSIAKQLVRQGVLSEPWRFIFIAKLLNKEAYLQAGEYTLNKNVSPYQLLLSLNHGKTTQASITFIEGHTFYQLQTKIKKNDALEQTLVNVPEAEIMKSLARHTLLQRACFSRTRFTLIGIPATRLSCNAAIYPCKTN